MDAKTKWIIWFGVAVLSLLAGLWLLSRRNPLSVLFVAAAIVMVFVTGFAKARTKETSR